MVLTYSIIETGSCSVEKIDRSGKGEPESARLLLWVARDETPLELSLSFVYLLWSRARGMVLIVVHLIVLALLVSPSSSRLPPQGHKDSIEALLADGLFFLSGSCDGAVRVWNVSSLDLEGGMMIMFFYLYAPLVVRVLLCAGGWILTLCVFRSGWSTVTHLG